MAKPWKERDQSIANLRIRLYRECELAAVESTCARLKALGKRRAKGDEAFEAACTDQPGLSLGEILLHGRNSQLREIIRAGIRELNANELVGIEAPTEARK